MSENDRDTKVFRELARKANEATEFHPVASGVVGPLEPDDDREYGFAGMTVAGVYVTAYVHRDGGLRVAVHTDDGEVEPWLMTTDEGQEIVPVSVTINGSTVYKA